MDVTHVIYNRFKVDQTNSFNDIHMFGFCQPTLKYKIVLLGYEISCIYDSNPITIAPVEAHSRKVLYINREMWVVLRQTMSIM